jgi:hypothetical protein
LIARSAVAFDDAVGPFEPAHYRGILLAMIRIWLILAVVLGVAVWQAQTGFRFSEDGAFWFVIALFAFAGLTAIVSHGWWGLLQMTIFCAVLGSNIQWQWTPNSYLAGLLALAAAWAVTKVFGWLIELPLLRHLLVKHERMARIEKRL